MAEEKKVHFIWEKTNYSGFVEKEYENSYLIVVANPSPDMEEKYTNRMIISKKACETAEYIVDKTRTTKK
ncbi:hypothetical protein [Enterococcus faecalis]|nr:hypothetical protein [Enterococcus faecalis]